MSIDKKPNLFDFMTKPASSGGTQPKSSSTSLATAIGQSLTSLNLTSLDGLTGSPNKASQFRDEVTKIASSDELLREVSKDVGAPRNGESEDEFVIRAKAAFRARLAKRLDNK